MNLLDKNVIYQMDVYKNRQIICIYCMFYVCFMVKINKLIFLEKFVSYIICFIMMMFFMMAGLNFI